ncbi:hypothetical protein ASZ90_004121 [hydrocarbon metagenome]|uniref:Uncharacterized protein n=1 Tax=hydrocarbon metagenome TaxID=938273 RepID=A0A0W8FYP4_9ZZZZ
MEKIEDKHEQLDRQLEQRKLENQRRFEANKIAELRRSKTQEVSESEKRAYVKKQLEGARLTPKEIAEKRRLRTPELLENANSEKERRHIENYREYKNLWESNKIEWGEPVKKNVNGRDIVSPELTDPQWSAKNEKFWSHHAKTFEEYRSYAEKLPQIKEQLSHGKKIEEIKLDKELGASANFWYSERPIKLTQYKDSLIVTESGFHRATLAKMYDLNDVPTEIKEAYIKK